MSTTAEQLREYFDQSYPPSLWNPPEPPEDGREAAAPASAYNEPAITAQNALNAAKLAGLGFVAAPQTAWTAGQGITINGAHVFSWTGTAWQAGAPVAEEPTLADALKASNAPTDEPTQPPATPEPQVPPDEPSEPPAPTQPPDEGE